MTQPDPNAPVIEPVLDRTGYTVHEQTPEGGGQTSWTITRDIDGTGLGAYADPAQIDVMIARDRRLIESLPAGMDHIPPLIAIQPPEPVIMPQQPQ